VWNTGRSDSDREEGPSVSRKESLLFKRWMISIEDLVTEPSSIQASSLDRPNQFPAHAPEEKANQDWSIVRVYSSDSDENGSASFRDKDSLNTGGSLVYLLSSPTSVLVRIKPLA
jgi:hypothetical protein